MQRRTFLSLCLGSATAATGATVGVNTLLRGWLKTSDSPVFPGATVSVGLSGHADKAWRVELEQRHIDGQTVEILPDLCPGTDTTVTVPYPFQELVPGAYSTSVCLRDGDGALIERLRIGVYTVRRPVFSA